MRKSIFTSLWTLAFIQAKDHQSQIDQISEDFQTEFSYRGRMIIPARRPLSGSVTPSWYQTGGPTNLPPSLCKSSNSDKAVHRCKLQNVCDGGDQFTLVPPLRTKSFKYYLMTILEMWCFFFVCTHPTSVINIFHLIYDSLCWHCPRPLVIPVRPTSSSPTHRFRKLVSPIGDLIGLGINPQRIRILATFIDHFVWVFPAWSFDKSQRCSMFVLSMFSSN